jgi:hypothetical protein
MKHLDEYHQRVAQGGDRDIAAMSFQAAVERDLARVTGPSYSRAANEARALADVAVLTHMERE